VHLHAGNNTAFSNEFAKLLLLIGSEVDVVAKMLCNQIDPNKSVKNIKDYRTVICGKFVGMHEVEIEIAMYSQKIQPWLSWAPSATKSPDWWKAYNDVKNERDKNFSQANQINTLNALCGLMVLLLYYYDSNRRHLQPYPQLLDHGFPSYRVTEGGKILPGF